MWSPPAAPFVKLFNTDGMGIGIISHNGGLVLLLEIALVLSWKGKALRKLLFCNRDCVSKQNKPHAQIENLYVIAK